MMEKFYEIAGIRIRVTGDEAELYTDDGILGEYAAQPGSWEQSIELRLGDSLPPGGKCIHFGDGLQVYSDGETVYRYFCGDRGGWEDAWLSLRRRKGESLGILRRDGKAERISVKILMNCMEAEHLLTVRQGLILHASFIEYKGRAILFTAPSGVGKSTQAELWSRLRAAAIINGDRAALRWENGGFYAYGLPFAGSSKARRNTRLPLAAVVCLDQAAQTEIGVLKGAAAFRRLWEGCAVNAWSRGDVELCSASAARLAETVPVFHLACRPDESAVEALERELEAEVQR